MQAETPGDVQIAPDKIGAAQAVAPQIAELAVRGVVAAVTGARARIDRGDEGVRVEPLDGPLCELVAGCELK